MLQDPTNGQNGNFQYQNQATVGFGPDQLPPNNMMNQGMMPHMPTPNQENYQGGPGAQSNGITNDMINNQRQTYGPITLSNGAIYTGELLNGMKDGYGQQVW